MANDVGRSVPDGLSSQATEPEVSALRASIPSAREKIIFESLTRCYVQTQDDRQQSMDLQYMGAETHDLASFIDRLIDDLDESCRHGFADWHHCGTCTIRDKIYREKQAAIATEAGTAETPSGSVHEARAGTASPKTSQDQPHDRA